MFLPQNNNYQISIMQLKTDDFKKKVFDVLIEKDIVKILFFFYI